MPKNRARITRRGQITIPIALRRELQLKIGDVLQFSVQNGLLTVGRARPLPKDQILARGLARAAYKRYRQLAS